MRDTALGLALITNARQAIGAALGRVLGSPTHHPGLTMLGATFVTLFRHGELRGCIGTLKAYRPVVDDVRANALAAAFQDPRFAALNESEFDTLSVEVSLLSPPEKLLFADEGELLSALEPGIDGVIMECAEQRATFLPQVWATLPVPRDFIAELKRKAGMRDDFWSAAVNVSRYGVTKWKESDFTLVEISNE
ncbi:MAG: AmmeMemoRadiSam system protein A [Betaproteobacteria bacterium]|nr:MAG: AmmeMemoRadiSam system protein A [Betaproteobacteria bacterium]